MKKEKGGCDDDDGGNCCVETAEGRTLTFCRTSPRKHHFLFVCVCVCVFRTDKFKADDGRKTG